jgi:hypothetical protein
MTNLFKQALLQATQMTRNADHLMDAGLIQDALAGQCPWPPTTPDRVDQNAIDVEARDVITPAPTQPIPTADAASTAFTKPTAHSAEKPASPPAGQFVEDEFVFASCTNRLYGVDHCARDGLPMPLVVLLHGCAECAWTLPPVRP